MAYEAQAHSPTLVPSPLFLHASGMVTLVAAETSCFWRNSTKWSASVLILCGLRLSAAETGFFIHMVKLFNVNTVKECMWCGNFGSQVCRRSFCGCRCVTKGTCKRSVHSLGTDFFKWTTSYCWRVSEYKNLPFSVGLLPICNNRDVNTSCR